MARFCTNCGTACNEQQVYCSNCNRPLEASHQTQYEQSMMWHKFVIYFLLFALAAVFVLAGIQFMLGNNYGEVKDLVYAAFDGLQSLDIICGLVYLGLAIFALYVRSRLLWREGNGPKLFYALLVINCILPLVYLVGFNMTLGELGSKAKRILEQAGITDTMDAKVWIVAASFAILLIGNVIYFKSRERLFGAASTYTSSYSPSGAPTYTSAASGHPVGGQQRPQGGAPAGGWTCDCGRNHAAYVTSCTCGLNKTDIQKRKAAAEAAKATEVAKAAEADKASETATAAETAKKDDLQDQIQAIKSYKELLDAGILTQEEFDAKKKELLGL